MSHPAASVPSPAEERKERPADRHRPAGRSLFPTDDPYQLVTACLEQHGCHRRGNAWTCPLCGKRKLYVTPARDHSSSVVLHCQVCDRGRHHPQGSVVLAKLGLTLRDLFSQNDATSEGVNRDVNQRSSNVVVVNSVDTRPRPDIGKLLTEHAEGRRKPVPVQLGPMPKHTTPDDRRVAEDMGLLLGLFKSAGETRPMPYAGPWAAERFGWGRAGFNRVYRSLRRLTRAGTIVHDGQCKQREKSKSPTKCYRAPLLAELREAELRAIDRVERDAVGVERARRGASEPPAELREQLGVDRAHAGAEDVGVVAAGDGARGPVEHAHHGNAVIGAQGVLGVDRAPAPDDCAPPWMAEFLHRHGGDA